MCTNSGDILHGQDLGGAAGLGLPAAVITVGRVWNRCITRLKEEHGFRIRLAPRAEKGASF